MKMDEFEEYLDFLAPALEHADRVRGLKDYCTGLMLPLERKSVEPVAAHLDPQHVSAKHQSLLHFVGQSAWSDEALLDRVLAWVQPEMERGVCEWFWIVDDTGTPKKGVHSVGVARQYCGQLGKQDNCQVAVSLSLATVRASLPMTWRLYLPQEWCDDAQRRQATGVPETITFATKPELALQQIWAAKTANVPIGIVLGDAAYGNECAFREALVAMELTYVVGIESSTTLWTPGRMPLPPPAYDGHGKPSTLLQRAAGHQPQSAKEVALGLPAKAWHDIVWREGSNTMLSSRFAWLRVRPAHRDYWRSDVRAEEWFLIEWPPGDKEPSKYWLSNLPAEITIEKLVGTAKMRWRIERDYEELKQEFGLGHYEGRSWRGFHHHATLCIAAYGFLLRQRLHQKKVQQRPLPSLSEGYRPRGAGAGAATRA